MQGCFLAWTWQTSQQPSSRESWGLLLIDCMYCPTVLNLFSDLLFLQDWRTSCTWTDLKPNPSMIRQGTTAWWFRSLTWSITPVLSWWLRLLRRTWIPHHSSPVRNRLFLEVADLYLLLQFLSSLVGATSWKLTQNRWRPECWEHRIETSPFLSDAFGTNGNFS